MSNVDLSKGVKIILLGESGVGKTNLIRVTTGEEFEQNSMSSSSGRSLNKIFIKNAKVVIFVYAIDNEPSFKELKYWIDLAKNELGNDFVMGIVANKIDLYEEQQVKEEVAIEFAKNQNIKFKATSALTEPLGFKCFLEELLIDYIKKIDPSCKDEVPVYGKNNENSFTLKKGGPNKKKEKKCC